VEEVVAKVMQVDKVVELFHTMVIVSLNMRNLNLEVSNLNNRLAIKTKEKGVLQAELDKERDFQREYKHNIEIWTNNKTENEQKIKALIQKF
jgi:ribosome maturation factor RimP